MRVIVLSDLSQLVGDARDVHVHESLLLEAGASLGNVFHGVWCRPMLRENQPLHRMLWPADKISLHVIRSTLGEAIS
jgi:hypothetical protein